MVMSFPCCSTLHLRAVADQTGASAGTGEQGSIAKNQGDGFATNLSVLASRGGASDPNSFFTTLLGKPYLQQVVIAPHVYGPSVSNDYTAASVAPQLWSRLSTSFGYLNKAVGALAGWYYKSDIPCTMAPAREALPIHIGNI